MWKALLAGLLLWTGETAIAASPLERYLAARERYVADIERDAPALDPQGLTEREELALSDLETQLKAIIGPLSIKGVSPEGKINLDTLLKELGYGKLDGLVHASPDKGTSAVATTVALLKGWLKAHENWWPGERNVPQDIEGALTSEEFYTQAVGTGAAFAKFADIPVTPSAGTSFATAMLVLQRQDVGPWMPNEILVSAVHGDRVFVLSQPVSVTIEPIPACAAVQRRFQKKADVAFRRCFGERIKEQS